MTTSQDWHPRLITPEYAGAAPTAAGLIGYLEADTELDKQLTAAMALVFTGFDVGPDEMERVMDLLLPRRLAYVHGNSPRTKVGSNLYTSTEYPAEFTISMHNELSYSSSWPSRLAFYCHTPAETGGATPLVDAARWLEVLDPEVREAFAGGVRYSQNLHGGRGLGKSWQDTFETPDRSVVDAFLTESGASWEWQPGGSLRITSTRPATIRHPETGQEVWFNQSDQWHPAALGDTTAAALAQIMPAEELPQSVTFADGTPIPDEYVIQIRDRGLAEAVDVNWKRGDVLVFDNIAVAHGRRSFTGARRVLVAMCD
jgi:alpha-ketoglutarate-dependent taurine dioxygenase